MEWGSGQGSEPNAAPHSVVKAVSGGEDELRTDEGTTAVPSVASALLVSVPDCDLRKSEITRRWKTLELFP